MRIIKIKLITMGDNLQLCKTRDHNLWRENFKIITFSWANCKVIQIKIRHLRYLESGTPITSLTKMISYQEPQLTDSPICPLSRNITTWTSTHSRNKKEADKLWMIWSQYPLHRTILLRFSKIQKHHNN